MSKKWMNIELTPEETDLLINHLREENNFFGKNSPEAYKWEVSDCSPDADTPLRHIEILSNFWGFQALNQWITENLW